MMKLSVDISGLDQVVRGLDSQVVKAASYRAINRTVDGVATDTSAEIRNVYNVKRQDIDPRIRKIYARDYERLSGAVLIKADAKSAIPLIMFNAVARQNMAGGGSLKTTRTKQTMMKSRTKTPGVSFKIMKSAGKGFSAKAFILPGGGGSKQVVYRTGPGKQGLHEKRVISPVGMVKSSRQGVLQRILDKGRERFFKNLEHELSRRR